MGEQIFEYFEKNCISNPTETFQDTKEILEKYLRTKVVGEVCKDEYTQFIRALIFFECSYKGACTENIRKILEKGKLSHRTKNGARENEENAFKITQCIFPKLEDAIRKTFFISCVLDDIKSGWNKEFQQILTPKETRDIKKTLNELNKFILLLGKNK